jgi:hypothetical protein
LIIFIRYGGRDKKVEVLMPERLEKTFDCNNPLDRITDILNVKKPLILLMRMRL